MKILNHNDRGLPTQVTQFGVDGVIHTTVTAVLTEGAIGDHAVYIGVGTHEFIARYGNKLRYAEAVQHFPSLTKDNYRG